MKKIGGWFRRNKLLTLLVALIAAGALVLELIFECTLIPVLIWLSEV